MHAIYSTPPVLYIAMWRASYITYSYVVMYNVSQEMAYMYVLCLITKTAYNVHVFSQYLRKSQYGQEWLLSMRGPIVLLELHCTSLAPFTFST